MEVNRQNPTQGQPLPPDFQSLVDFLRQPDSYRERPQEVEVVETHISVVFLTARCAYKLKKPVCFEFVDFSSVEKRRQACEEEVRLNRRLARDVYLGVVPITQTSCGQLRLGGEGQPVEWVVQMHRLPADRFLDHLIRMHELCDEDIARLAATLAEFYRQLPPLVVRPDEYRRQIEEHVRANFHELLSPDHGLPGTIVKRTHVAQLQFLKLSSRTFDERVKDLRIVEGHGDLRPEHICLASPPAIFDCLEFDRQLREIDVVDELSFLAMECDALGAPAVGQRVFEAYCRSSGDRPSPQLACFYRTYRACVRAKVAALRARQLPAKKRQESLAQAANLLRLADGYRRSLIAPLVLVVRGLSGTGKSTLARALTEALGVEYVATDQIRREIFGSAPTPAGYGQDRYQVEARAQVYDELFRLAGELLSDGLSVVLDGTFLRTSSQTRAAALAARHGATPIFITCRCPINVAKERIEKRVSQTDNLSEIQPLMCDLQQEEQEPSPAEILAVDVDTTESIPSQLAAVFATLASHVVPLANETRAFV